MQSEEQWEVIGYCPDCGMVIYEMDGAIKYPLNDHSCYLEKEQDDRSDEEKCYPNLNEEDWRAER